MDKYAAIQRAFENVDSQLLDVTGRLYVQIRGVLDAIIGDIAARTNGNQATQDIPLPWVELLTDEQNAAVNHELRDAVGEPCWTVCEHLRLALAACIGDISVSLALEKEHAKHTLAYYYDEVLDDPSCESFSAWAEVHLSLESDYLDDKQQEAAE
jgi:hypothetical protein